MKIKKIAGVSVNTEHPPKKQDLIKSALKTVDFYRNPDAKELIEKAIQESGLYTKIPTANKSKAKQARNSKSSGRADTAE